MRKIRNDIVNSRSCIICEKKAGIHKDQQKVYDRLGLDDQYMEILGVQIPMNTIPITPGRNLAVILEVAAMNNRQRKMGYNPALEFTQQMDRHFAESREGTL